MLQPATRLIPTCPAAWHPPQGSIAPCSTASPGSRTHSPQATSPHLLPPTPQVETVPLLVNNAASGYVGVNLYCDDQAQVKELPVNVRASQIADCCGRPMQVGDGAGRERRVGSRVGCREANPVWIEEEQAAVPVPPVMQVHVMGLANGGGVCGGGNTGQISRLVYW